MVTLGSDERLFGEVGCWGRDVCVATAAPRGEKADRLSERSWRPHYLQLLQYSSKHSNLISIDQLVLFNIAYNSHNPWQPLF